MKKNFKKYLTLSFILLIFASCSTYQPATRDRDAKKHAKHTQKNLKNQFGTRFER